MKAMPRPNIASLSRAPTKVLQRLGEALLQPLRKFVTIVPWALCPVLLGRVVDLPPPTRERWKAALLGKEVVVVPLQAAELVGVPRQSEPLPLGAELVGGAPPHLGLRGEASAAREARGDPGRLQLELGEGRGLEGHAHEGKLRRVLREEDVSVQSLQAVASQVPAPKVEPGEAVVVAGAPDDGIPPGGAWMPTPHAALILASCAENAAGSATRADRN